MLEYQRKQKVKNILYSKASILILIVFLGFLAKGAWGMYGKMKASSEARETTARELKNVSDRKNSVTKEIGSLKTKEGMESEIRSKFNVAMPGEQVLILIKGEEAPQEIKEEGFFQSMITKTKVFFTGE
jgi:cell division protein FtsB